MSLFRGNPIGSLFTGGRMTPGQTIGRAYADFGKTIGGIGTAAADVITKRADEEERQRLSEEARKFLSNTQETQKDCLQKAKSCQ